MPHTIGPKRLKHLLDAGIDPHTLALQQQFEFARTMAHLLSHPPPCTPKRDRPLCGARCRDGHRCQARAVWDKDQDCAVNGRCRNHGGFSSGPKTQAGKQRIAAAARQRAQARHRVQAEAVERAAPWQPIRTPWQPLRRCASGTWRAFLGSRTRSWRSRGARSSSGTRPVWRVAPSHQTGERRQPARRTARERFPPPDVLTIVEYYLYYKAIFGTYGREALCLCKASCPIRVMSRRPTPSWPLAR